MSGMAAGSKAKLGKVPTANDLPETMMKTGTLSKTGGGTATSGTGFNTAHASANEGEQRGINQSKENIILSEQSSVKQMDWENEKLV